MKTRIEQQHFLSEGKNLLKDNLNSVHIILFHECISEQDMKIRERYLINILNPRFNIQLKKQNIFSFEIIFEWKYLPVDVHSLLEEYKKRKENKVLGNLVNYNAIIKKECSDKNPIFKTT